MREALTEPGKPSVCIVSLYTWPLFETQCASAFGGSEVRIAAIARGLARRGNVDVKMVVWDHGQGWQRTIDGVEFFPWPDPAPPAISTALPPADENRPASRWRVVHWAWAARGRGGIHKVAAAAPLGALAVIGLGQRVYHGILARAADWRARHVARRRAAVRINNYNVDRSRFELFDAISPDAVIVHGATSISAQAVAWCVARRTPSVFIAGSDIDFTVAHRQEPHKRTQYGDLGFLASYAVANASAHVVQTPAQLESLRTLYGRDATIVRNPIDLTRQFPREEDGTVLWVGKSDATKRPELAINLARRIPTARFLLVMTPSDPELHRRIQAEAAELPNVAVVDSVPFNQIESLFARAAVFLSTSRFEGFPNTFLQAAKYEVPVASLTVDPARMIAEHGAGICANEDLGLLATELALLLSDAQRRQLLGHRALGYVRRYHDAGRALETIESVIFETIAGKSPRLTNREQK